MTELLKNYYEKELEYFRHMSAEFANAYPKIASRLGIDERGVRDASAEHVIQGVALLNARIRKKIDDDFPELVDSIFDIVYPDFLKPTPSLSLVQFQLAGKEGDAGSLVVLPAETTTLQTETSRRIPLVYRTCYPVELRPLDVTSCSFQNKAFDPPKREHLFHEYRFDNPVKDRKIHVDSRLEMKLTVTSDNVTPSEICPDRLRLFINLPQMSFAGRLSELLFQRLLGIVVTDAAQPNTLVTLPATTIQAVGFAPDENLFPQSPRSFEGYRLLQEYFSFPWKFLFFDLVGLKDACSQLNSCTLIFHFYFSEPDAELENRITRDSLLLGCAPVVNLFPSTASEIHLNRRKSEYRVMTETRNEDAEEIYAVTEVNGIDENGESSPIEPLYGSKNPQSASQSKCFWHISRRELEERDSYAPAGYQYWITLVNFMHERVDDLPQALDVRTLSMSRDLPNSFGEIGEKCQFRVSEHKGIECRVLVTPTPTRRRSRDDLAYWQLLSHLSLNYTSLQSTSGTPALLQKILHLYDPVSTHDSQEQINGVTGLRHEPGIRYLDHTLGGFCRGLQIDMTFDESRFAGNSPYLLASVLDHFLSLYVNVNSYTELSASTQRMNEKGTRWRWSPKAGGRPLQ
ncbi:MAG: type VI secretion system baseplate subunit TssF [Planctomycetaceae bacterium]